MGDGEYVTGNLSFITLPVIKCPECSSDHVIFLRRYADDNSLPEFWPVEPVSEHKPDQPLYCPKCGTKLSGE